MATFSCPRVVLCGHEGHEDSNSFLSSLPQVLTLIQLLSAELAPCWAIPFPSIPVCTSQCGIYLFLRAVFSPPPHTHTHTHTLLLCCRRSAADKRWKKRIKVQRVEQLHAQLQHLFPFSR